MAEQQGTASSGRQARAAAQGASEANGAAAPSPTGGNLGAAAAALIWGEGAAPPPPEDDELEEGDAPAAPPPPADDDAGEGEGTDDALEGDDAGDAPTAKPKSLDEAAERLGLTRKELNDLEFTIGRDSMSLGKIKQRWGELQHLDSEREILQDDRGTWEMQRIAQYRSLSSIIDQLPKNAYTAGLLRQIERNEEVTRDRELQSLHFARPKWADPTFATGAKQKIFDAAKKYGFSRVEIEGLMDHRFILWAQDHADLLERVQASRDAARKVNEPSQARGAGQGAAQRPAEPTNRGPRVKLSQEQRSAQLGALIRRR